MAMELYCVDIHNAKFTRNAGPRLLFLHINLYLFMKEIPC